MGILGNIFSVDYIFRGLNSFIFLKLRVMQLLEDDKRSGGSQSNNHWTGSFGLTNGDHTFLTGSDKRAMGSGYGVNSMYSENETFYDIIYNDDGIGDLISWDVRSYVTNTKWVNVGNYLLPSEKHFNGSVGLIGITAYGFNKIPKGVRRHYAHKLSKITNWKSGQIFQNTKNFANGAGKLSKTLGPLGTALTVGVIGYEVSTDTWDAHTVINAALLVGAGAAIFFAAPAVLTGIALYGVGDYFFDFSGSIDSTIGRNSTLW